MRYLDPASIKAGARAGALLGVLLLGLTSIVGSGGGVAFMPSDCPPQYNCNAPPPTLNAAVQPPYATVVVGAGITFAVTANYVVGSASYHWARSSDGGVSFADIGGATGPAYTVAAANLADDATAFQVTVRDGAGAVAMATARLAVSATPGLIFRDTEFSASDWLVTPLANAGASTPEHSEESLASGGHPGAWRKMVVQIAPQSGSGRVFYTSLVASYDPGSQGAIRLIDYAEEGISLQPNVLTYTDSAMLLEQAGRRYVAVARNDVTEFLPTDWSSNQSRASLRATDFSLIQGAACQAGEACPDFSAQGGPMRFGYWRISFGVQGDVIAHGIDNWQVTVWRQ
jgi:hypothetical protein